MDTNDELSILDDFDWSLRKTHDLLRCYIKLQENGCVEFLGEAGDTLKSLFYTIQDSYKAACKRLNIEP